MMKQLERGVRDYLCYSNDRFNIVETNKFNVEPNTDCEYL